jgi:ubiquinone/menaquinone biosynthesis C-methylase UbiE
MKNSKNIRETLWGKNREVIPNLAFRMMTGIMRLMDFLGKYSNKNFKTLELKAGQTVVDYGCGPARYVQNASKIVGKSGRVLAVDNHPLAIRSVEMKIKKHHLENVETVLVDGYSTSIPSAYADVVYALDMFHMITRPTELLIELCRILKQDGVLIIEDGHQPRKETIQKIESSGVLIIIQETKFHLKCKKRN